MQVYCVVAVVFEVELGSETGQVCSHVVDLQTPSWECRMLGVVQSSWFGEQAFSSVEIPEQVHFSQLELASLEQVKSGHYSW
jgi:hypothetical protein